MNDKEKFGFRTTVDVFKNGNDNEGYNIDLFETKNEKVMKKFLCSICFNVCNEPWEFHCDKNHFGLACYYCLINKLNENNNKCFINNECKSNINNQNMQKSLFLKHS